MRKIDANRIVALTGKYVSAAPLNMLSDILYFISLLNALAIIGMASAAGGWSAMNNCGLPCDTGMFQRILAPSTCDRGVCANIENPIASGSVPLDRYSR